MSDVVERHDVEQFAQGWREPYYLRHRWTSLLSTYLPDGVIAISRSLERSFAAHQPVLRLPALIDIAEYAPPAPRATDSPLVLLYSGTPTNKDQLGTLIDAVLAGTNEPRPVELVVAGATAEQLASNPDVGPDRVARFGERIRPLGWLSRDDVIANLRRADFSVLLRPPHGYAHAGFPSKVPESLAAGCPIFGNLTSDLGDYLRDLENAVICETGASGHVTLETASSALSRANLLTDEQLKAMKHSARQSAEQLHYAHWAPALSEWLETLR
jgi:glycosyltransferase involved in cell wall biosynthesis